MSSGGDLTFLHAALDQAKKCQPITTAFCVGCVLTVRWPSETDEPIMLATGYSRELPGNTHAEANALAKARSMSPTELSTLFPTSESSRLKIDDILRNADVYTTMEPCSIRKSGLAPCADALIDAGVRRCYIGVSEPDDFVTCEGAQKMQAAGVEVFWMSGLENECLSVARRGHDDVA